MQSVFIKIFRSAVGIAASTSIVYFISAIYLLPKIRHKIGIIFDGNVFKTLLKALTAGAIMAAGVMGWFALLDEFSFLLATFSGIFIGVAIYFLVSYILRMEELVLAPKLIKDLLRLRNGIESQT